VSRLFRFEDSWTVPAPPETVREVVVDLEHYPRWWPQVRAVASLGPEDAWVLCRSLLPYTLDLVLHAVSRDLPTVEVAIDGDLRGHAAWTLTPVAGGLTRMEFVQEVEILRLPDGLVRLARPVLAWNHDRMMSGCRAGLQRRLG
jgi:uncharacterized protein YndB with AHSA1/START domain